MRRGLAALLLAGSILAILFAGTFPFDFAFPHRGPGWTLSQRFDWRWHPYDPALTDRLQNILFFMPFGFALAGVFRPSRRRWIWQLSAALVGGIALSSLIEILQAFVSFRDPSFADIWCNALGAVVAAGVYAIVGDPLMGYAVRGLRRLRPLGKPALVAAAAAGYALLHLLGPLTIRNPGDLSVWDPTMLLLIGNELSGDRGWNGGASNVLLADRAANTDEVLHLARQADPVDVFGSALLADYKLAGKAPFADRTGRQPPLQWADQPSDLPLPDMVLVSEQSWLRTASPMRDAIQRIGQASQFTLAATVATFDPWQTNPAPRRIVNISSGIWNGNVLLGQDGADLVVRVRTAVRSMPSLYVRDIFTDTTFHHIAVTAAAGQFVIYVDGAERGRCEVTPEAKMIWRFYPRTFRLRAENFGFRSYAMIYRLVVFIPLAALVAAALFPSRLAVRTKRIAAVAAICLVAIALEVVLGSLSASGFQWKNLGISLAAGFSTLGAISLWSRFERQAPRAATVRRR